MTTQAVLVNGQPGLRTFDPAGRLVYVLSLDIEDGRVQRIFSLLNPDKLGHLGEISDVGLRRS